MSLRGIAVDAMNPFGRPTVRQLKLLHVNGVRIVAFDEPMWFTYYRELEAAGFLIAVAFTGQSFNPEESYAFQCQRYLQQIDPAIVVLANEFNVQHDATWPYRGEPESDDALVAFWNEAAPAIRAVRPGAKLYTSWYSDPDPISHIRDVHAQLTPKPTGADYHAYDESYNDAERIFEAIRSEIGCEVACLEWHDSDPVGVKRFQKILNHTTDHSAWFCHHDLMVMPHGVIDAGGHRKPTWYALRDSLRGIAP